VTKSYDHQNWFIAPIVRTSLSWILGGHIVAAKVIVGGWLEVVAVRPENEAHKE
jgi:hypothetical protein